MIAASTAARRFTPNPVVITQLSPMPTAPAKKPMSAEAVAVCGKVNARVSASYLTGMSKNEALFMSTVPAHDAFMEALQAWDESRTEEDKQAVRAAADTLVDVWREAAVEFQRMRDEEKSNPTQEGQR